MHLKNIIFVLIFVSAIWVFIKSCCNLAGFISIGIKESRTDKTPERVKKVAKIAFLQTKLFREPLAGSLHFTIFWGFLLFLAAVAESIGQGFYSGFSLIFLGPVYKAITLTQDLFGILVIGAVVISIFRRYILKIPRLVVDKAGKKDALLILLLILIVVLSMYGQNVFRYTQPFADFGRNEVRPVSKYIAQVLFPMGYADSAAYYEVFWWIHILSVLSFLNYLPYSKHLHILTAIPNVFLSKDNDKKGALKPLNLEDENAEVYGANDVELLSRKQLLDGFSCTECGRCTAACPAANSGKSLSPKEIIVNVKKRTFQKAPLLVMGKTDEKAAGETLLGSYISEKELWQCTTCMACVQECPVTIEHIDTIVDLRRYLVLTESRFPAELNSVFKNLETNYTPWAFSQSQRADWTEGLGIKTMSEDPDCELLFWVGCAGSFDARYKKVSRAFATLMQKANIEFRILGVEEKCNGDTARRLGNEYLAQTLVQENVATLNKYNVKKIVTACPHCFNSLKNEFKQFGGEYEVIHHSQLITEMIKEKLITLSDSKLNCAITYHDSCYLGRYNGIYNEPRQAIEAVKGLKLVEMERNKSRGFCCGAGGGRMFLEDEEGERINNGRVKEAIDTGAETIASACPFCLTMLDDGLKTYDKQNEIEVKDIAEIVLENSK